MSSDQLYQVLLGKLKAQLKVLEDKPEETPTTTLRALWFTAAGEPKSAQAAEKGELPELEQNQAVALEEMVLRRLQGVPLAHITHRQQFMGVELLAGPEALVPRKETELLGNAALEVLQQMSTDRDSAIVIDVCTGAGNLAVAFAHNATQVRVFAADLSEEAVNLARQNAEFVGVQDRVEMRAGDLLAPFNEDEFMGSVDLLTCNPPYISSAKVDAMHEEIANHEPRLAFDGGPFGIKILQRLIKEAPRYLKPGGWLGFEVGLGQGPGWIQRLEKTGNFDDVRPIKDAAGDIRAILAQYTNQ